MPVEGLPHDIFHVFYYPVIYGGGAWLAIAAIVMVCIGISKMTEESEESKENEKNRRKAIVAELMAVNKKSLEIQEEQDKA